MPKKDFPEDLRIMADLGFKMDGRLITPRGPDNRPDRGPIKRFVENHNDSMHT